MDILQYLNRQTKPWLLIPGYLLVFFIGFIDYITGPEISFSIFYLFPISLIAWFINRSGAIFVSIGAALTWLVADLVGNPSYSHPIIPYWNAIVRLSFFLIVSILLSTLKKALRTEGEIARNDFLTGVGNTRLFYELANQEIERSRRYRHAFSVLYLDLDNFKTVNDHFGHSIGDNVLQSVASTIRNNIRESDIVARLGGDEFAILLPETNLSQARIVANNIQNNLSVEMEKNKWPVTLSIGAYTFVKPPESIDEMIRHADALMYLAKSEGKNTVRTESNSSETEKHQQRK